MGDKYWDAVKNDLDKHNEGLDAKEQELKLRHLEAKTLQDQQDSVKSKAVENIEAILQEIISNHDEIKSSNFHKIINVPNMGVYLKWGYKNGLSKEEKLFISRNMWKNMGGFFQIFFHAGGESIPPRILSSKYEYIFIPVDNEKVGNIDIATFNHDPGTLISYIAKKLATPKAKENFKKSGKDYYKEDPLMGPMS